MTIETAQLRLDVAKANEDKEGIAFWEGRIKKKLLHPKYRVEEKVEVKKDAEESA